MIRKRRRRLGSLEPDEPVPAAPRRKRKYLILKLPDAPAFRRPRYDLIVERAEARARRRRGEADPDRDWFEAEAEVERMLARSRPF